MPNGSDWKSDPRAIRLTLRPHVLAYFTHDVFERAEACDGCTPEQQAELQKMGRAVVSRIGEIRGFAIYVENYTCACLQTGYPDPNGKSVLVQTGPDEYHEIFFGRMVNAPNGGISGPTILQADEDQALVWFRSDGGGNRHPMEDYALRLDSTGSARISLDPILNARRTVLPQGNGLSPWRLELLAGLHSFTMRVPVSTVCPPAFEDRPCEENGTIEVEFKRDGDHFTPLGRRYLP